jgi:hypothetical protein
MPGTYQVEVHLKDMARHLIEFVPQTFQFEVAETEVYGGRKLDGWFGSVGLRAQALENISRKDAKVQRKTQRSNQTLCVFPLHLCVFA